MFRVLKLTQLNSMKRTCSINKFGSFNLCTLLSSLSFHCLSFPTTTILKYKSHLTSIASMSTQSTSKFSPKRALVLGKFSRYDFEKHRNPNLSEEELIQSLERRGSDYNSLVHHHKIHTERRDHIVECLRKRNIETKVINRFAYNENLIDWADIIITSGGDGTYLLAASKIRDSSKPLIGVNSDPARSVGHLCLPHKYSNDFGAALDKITKGDFEWTFRHRIRITLEGENALDSPIELHDQQLMHLEYRFLELESIQKTVKSSAEKKNMKRILPFRALNEVFVGESLSSRVSYFELSINETEKKKIKSSGITICTGTGSTSWSFNINKLTTQCVQNFFKIINEECPGSSEAPILLGDDQNLIERVTKRFNDSLIFPPWEPLMAYTIRDPVVFDTNFNSNPRDFASKIKVKSRMTDAHIVIDGGLSYVFNDGADASFEICEEDALRTIKLSD